MLLLLVLFLFRWAKAAVSGTIYHYNQLKAKYNPKPVLVGEIGWPTVSGPADLNLGSKETARAFVKEWTKVGGGWEAGG